MTNEYEIPIESEYEPEVIALAEYLDVDIDDITEDAYVDNAYEVSGCTYLVLDDEDADDMAREYILHSLWAFNADFIIRHTDIPYDAIEIIQSYQENRCEDANDTIKALITDIDEFVDDAICSDGRGHFMNSYDGDEIEHGEYYIYRMD